MQFVEICNKVNEVAHDFHATKSFDKVEHLTFSISDRNASTPTLLRSFVAKTCLPSPKVRAY